MSLFKKEQGDLKVVRPPVLGWLEKKLSDKEMDYLWRCIDNHKKSIKSTLIGQIHESNDLIDKSDWFFNNTQKQNEFNPLHNHNGVYSFVIWMKIPTKHNEQNNNPISSRANAHLISAFQFSYQDIIGGYRTRTYKMNPEIEGTMLFFPAKLQHCVHPFYNCDEDRISISGNISLNTAKLL